jgi:hypothetical protein
MTDQEIPLSSYDYLYHEQGRNPRTPITTLFFSLDNLVLLQRQIEAETSQQLQEEIQMASDGALFGYLEELLQSARNYQAVTSAVQDLNLIASSHQVKLLYHSARRRQLYCKWFFQKDRQLVLNPPENTNGRRRLDNPSIGTYSMNNPTRHAFAEFQQQQYDLQQPVVMPELFDRFYHN